MRGASASSPRRDGRSGARAGRGLPIYLPTLKKSTRAKGGRTGPTSWGTSFRITGDDQGLRNNDPIIIETVHHQEASKETRLPDLYYEANPRSNPLFQCRQVAP